jgi:hypothetical protein
LPFAHDGARRPLLRSNKQSATLDQQNAWSKLFDSTGRFKDVKVAEAEGYALQFGCMSGDDMEQWDFTINGNLVNGGV